MVAREYYEKLFTSFSDPILVANAFENYYRRIYERTLEKVSLITNQTTTRALSVNEKFPIQLNNGTNYIVSLKELKQIFSFLYEEDSEASLDVVIHDLISDQDIQVSTDDLSTAIGNTVDSTYVTWQGFRSLVKESADKGQEFLNTVQLKMSSGYSSVKQSIEGIYDTLSDSSSSVLDKLTTLCQFVGFKQAAEDPETIEEVQIDLADYTGINPVVSWLGGIDWANIGLTVVSIPVMVTKFMAKSVVTIFTGAFNLLKGTFSWIGNWFKKTFVDPVDYKCDDDILEYFKIPGKFFVPLHITNENDSVIWDILNDNDSGEYWLNDGGVYSHVRKVDQGEHQGYTVERYVKPMDPQKLYDVINQFFSSGGTYEGTIKWSETGPSQKWIYTDLTGDDLLNLTYQLSNTDLSMLKDAPEKDVYLGLMCSLKIQEAFDYLRSNIGQYYYGFDVGGGNLLQEFDTSVNVYNMNPDVTNWSIESYTPYSLIESLLEIYTALSYYLGYQPTSGIAFYYLEAMGKRIDIKSFINQAVTNKDFISILTTSRAWFNEYTGSVLDMQLPSVDAFIVSGLNGESGRTEQVQYVGDYISIADMTLFNSSTRYSVFSSSRLANPSGRAPSIAGCMCGGSLRLLGYSRVRNAGTDKDGAFVPYLERRPKFTANISIVTDQEHSDAIGKFVKGAAIAAAVLAATIIGGVLVTKAVKTVRQAGFKADAYAASYGQAIKDGDAALASDLYSKWKKQHLITNTIGRLFGSSSDIILPSVRFSDSPTEEKISKILSLIK